MISVIIPTMNRAAALGKTSLPSLLRQNNADFEVIVWDASEGNESAETCELLRENFAAMGASLRYSKAPRRGSASQRNDAADTAEGDILFFTDDDCELPADAISALCLCFKSSPWLEGAGLPWLNKTPASGNSPILGLATLMFGMKNRQLRRKINGHGGLSLPIKDLPGPAEWLSGGSMAFRRGVFEKLRFDERLETFGGYALGEDYDFSHRVMLEFGEPLMVAHGGYVIHHAAAGKRMAGKEKIATHFFNAALIRKNFEQYGKRYGAARRAWGALGVILMLLRDGAKIADIIAGVRMAAREFKKY